MKNKILTINKILIFLVLLNPLYGVDLKDFKPKTFNFKVDTKEELILKRELQLLESSLIISGVPVGLLHDYRKKIENIFDSIVKEISNLNEYSKADKALQLLHEKLFKTYKENITSIKETIDNGYFNCVSSSLVYNILAEKIGLETRGILLKDHIFTQIKINNEWIDVETTVKFGFDPGKRKETIDEFNRLTRFVYVPPSKRSGKEEIVSNWEYLAVMYANIGVEYLNKKEFDNALSYFLKGVLIRSDLTETSHNLKAGYITYSIHMAERKEFEKAENLLKEILTLYPEFELAKNNLKSIYINWANYLFDLKKYEDGIKILENNKELVKNDEIKNFYLVWAQNLYISKNYPEAIRVLDTYSAKYGDNSILGYIKDIKIAYAEEIIRKGGDPKPIIATISLKTADDLEVRCYLFTKAKEINLCFSDIKIFLKEGLSNEIIKIIANSSYNGIEVGKIDEVVEFMKYINNNYKNEARLNSYYQKVIESIGFYYFKEDPDKGITLLKNIGKTNHEFLQYTINSGSKIFYQSKLYPLLNKREYEKALTLVKEGYQDFPSDLMKDTYKKLVSVYASELYKNKKYDESYNVLLDGIKVFPDDTYIKTNYKTVANTLLQIYKDDRIKKKKIEDEMKKYLKD